MPAAAKDRKPARSKGAKGKAARAKKPGARVTTFTAATADRHVLYQLAVQNVEAEIDFVDEAFEGLRGRKATRLREDFCGTGFTSCEWVRRRPGNTAVGLDIDQPTLDWGQEHNVAALPPGQRERVSLLNRNVLHPGDASGVDVVLAMNFSYWLFMTRAEMVRYFRSVRESLGDGGVLFLDHYGGSDAMAEMEETRLIEGEKGYEPFTYLWDQAEFNPITGAMTCHIHFKFKDKTKLKQAFTYHWRLWSLTEIQDCLRDAGFADVKVYWEGDELDDDGEETGEGNGEFTATTQGTADPAFICYIAALK